MRLLQLQADIQLTPEDRVKAGEETARLGYLLHPPTGNRLVQFDRYEDYLTWKRLQDAADIQVLEEIKRIREEQERLGGVGE